MVPTTEPTVEQFFRTFALTNFEVSKDEQKLFFTSNMSGKMNVWAMDLPGTFPYLFSQYDESCGGIYADPKQRHVFAQFDKDGDENYHIFTLPYEGGIPQPFITGKPEDKYFLSEVSEDGNRVYYMTSEGNPSFLNTYVHDLSSGEKTLLHEGEEAATSLSAISPEESSFVYTSSFANTYVISSVKVGDEMIDLTPNREEVHVSGNALYTNENDIYFITNYDSEYVYVAKFDINSRSFTPVVTFDDESVTTIKWNKKDGLLYIVTEKGVQDYLYAYNIANETLESIDTPVDVIAQVQVAKSGNVYVLGMRASKPANIYKREHGEWNQLTNNRVLGVSPDQMVEPDVITYNSFDGMEIEALLFKPHAEKNNGYTVFWPHGGPQAAERKFYRSLFQCLAYEGYTVFAPNFRGSTGYGSSFVKLVEQDWGEGPRLDCMAGVDWLMDNGHTTKEKLFLVGGSYGGYMALLLHGRHADSFKAVIDIFGPSDLTTFVNSVPPHWKPMMERWLGDPDRDKERFKKDSPITYLEDMTKPMLVIQGAKDPRVVKEESDQIVAELREIGRDVEYIVLDDEGHGFSKKENEIHVYTSCMEFLEKHQD
ncbi:MAG TPA: S9 family peptidase [Bacillota bacterium]|nr:S9 family peptidase [Bacillota bacterium]